MIRSRVIRFQSFRFIWGGSWSYWFALIDTSFFIFITTMNGVSELLRRVYSYMWTFDTSLIISITLSRFCFNVKRCHHILWTLLDRTLTLFEPIIYNILRAFNFNLKRKLFFASNWAVKKGWLWCSFAVLMWFFVYPFRNLVFCALRSFGFFICDITQVKFNCCILTLWSVWITAWNVRSLNVLKGGLSLGRPCCYSHAVLFSVCAAFIDTCLRS